MRLARQLTPSDSLRPHTYVTIIGLLWVSGLRIGEVLRLNLEDVDLGRDLLLIRQTKNHQTRLVPITQSASQALAAYQPLLKASFSSLEGYIAAQILFKGLDGIKGPVTREAVAEALESLEHFDIGMDQSLHLNNVEHQACHRVWPMVLENGRAVPFDWRQLAQSVARSRHE
jgi:site-specific recombinase XerD